MARPFRRVHPAKPDWELRLPIWIVSGLGEVERVNAYHVRRLQDGSYCYLCAVAGRDELVAYPGGVQIHTTEEAALIAAIGFVDELRHAYELRANELGNRLAHLSADRILETGLQEVERWR